MFEKQKEFACKHIMLNNVHHFAGGFGLALILQYYLVGDPFLSVIIGWVLLGFSAVMHAYEFIFIK